MAEARGEPAPRLHAISPDGPLYRIARLPDPWAWPDWANVGSDGTFGNRWDDPQGVYRVLYASSSRLGAMLEVLARFRPDPQVAEALAAIAGDSDDAADGFAEPGVLDPGWLPRRGLGVAPIAGEFVDVGHSTSLAHLRDALASRLVHHGLDDLDAATVRISAPRRFTQEVSRYVYDLSSRAGTRRFSGIAYRSRLGDELRNWALFESPGGGLPSVGTSEAGTPEVGTPEVRSLAPDDPDLQRALATLGVRFGRPGGAR